MQYLGGNYKERRFWAKTLECLCNVGSVNIRDKVHFQFPGKWL